jgi:dinuclear metal center YbgI/SA1388 family protein
MPILKEIINLIEIFTPKSLQEPYDNSGLLVGNPEMKISKAIVTLDCIESVIDEAIQEGAELIIAHHPIIFVGLKSITGKNYIERVLLKAIKYDIAIYAAHTNLDNIKQGVNKKIAEKLALDHCKILSPKANSIKHLYVYTPNSHAIAVRNALLNAGAGKIGNYSNCSFTHDGTGTYLPLENSNPFQGNRNELHQGAEQKIEVTFPFYLENKILKALTEAHPYEEIAFGIIPLANTIQDIGAGMIGNLPKPLSKSIFLQYLKENLNLNCIRFTKNGPTEISKVAICGGSGSFLLQQAIEQKADAFVSADFKYHEFFDGEQNIVIADIGHYESEQFTMEIFIEILSNKFPNFAIQITSVNTNPIQYY